MTCIYVYLDIQRLICAKTSRNSTTPGHQLRHLAESAKIRIKSGKKETSKNRGLNSWLNRDIAYNSLFGCSNGHALEFFFHGFSIVVRKSLPSYREQRLGETCRKQQTSNQTSRARARIYKNLWCRTEGVTAHMWFFAFLAWAKVIALQSCLLTFLCSSSSGFTISPSNGQEKCSLSEMCLFIYSLYIIPLEVHPFLPSVPSLLLFPFPPFLSFPILSYPFLSFPILSYPFLSFPILSYPFLSFPILSYPFLSFPILSYPFLSFPILSYPFLSFPILSYPFLSFPILSYPFLLSSLFALSAGY